MDGNLHHRHDHHHAAAHHGGAGTAPLASGTPGAHADLNRLALSATLHCLTGCGIGEVLGMVLGTALGWGNLPTIALAVALAFAFGYALTLVPLLRAGLGLGTALGLALAADTASITIMEVVDNAVMLAVPGAMDAGLTGPLFWASLALALVVAAAAAFPVNRWLIARGRGHAVVHAHHGHRH
jgi:Domain of unknown function (DUF4396)